MKNLNITLSVFLIALCASTLVQAQSINNDLRNDSIHQNQLSAKPVVEQNTQIHIWVDAPSEEAPSREVLSDRNSSRYQLADVKIFLYANNPMKSRWEDSLIEKPFINKQL